MGKRLLLSVILAALFATTLGASPADAALSGCSGYNTVATLSSSGHRLSTQVNVCVNLSGYDGGKALYTAVARYKCYRDGVLFGGGTGGCRWQGHLKVYAGGTTPNQLMTDYFWAVPGSTSSAFWSDSDRIYGHYAAVNLDWVVKGCAEDAIVHFMGITGIDYGTYNMADMCSHTVLA
jgi:hypothetical protein